MKHKILLLVGCLLMGFSPKINLMAQPTSYIYAYLSQDMAGNVQISTVDPGDNTSSILTTFTTSNQRPIVQTAVNADGSWIALAPTPDFENINPRIYLVNTITLEVRDIPGDLAIGLDQYITLSDPKQRLGWSPDGTKLAFASFHGEFVDVYVYTLADDTLTQITNDEGYETRISWSNDGTRLAILHNVCANVDACIADLNIINMDNSIVEFTVPISWEGGSLYEQEICHVKWSPDDSYIAFMQICDPSLYATVKEVYLLDVQQQTLHEVTNYTRQTDLPDDSLYMIRAGAYDLIWYDPQTLLIGSSIMTGTATSFTTQTASYSLTNQTLTTLNTTAMAQEWAVNPVVNQLAYRTSSGAYFEQQNSAVKISTFSNNTLNEIYTVSTGCDLSWSPDGLWLAATNRGLPLETCSDPMQGIQFVSGQNGAVIQHNVASTIIDKPIGWLVKPAPLSSPTADASIDQSLTDSDNNGSELVNLDGSGSSDPDGTIVSYSWIENGLEIATGVNPQVNLSVGVHTITLTVTDDDGLTDSDEVVITVDASQSTPTFPEVLDAFNRADGSVGVNWSGDTGSYSIVDNQLAVSGLNKVILWNATLWGADQGAEITVVDTSGSSDTTFGVVLKAQSTSGWTSGAVGASYSTDSESVTVWSYDPGQGAVQHGQPIPVTFVDGDRLRAYARADGVVEVYRNDSLVGTRGVLSWPHAAGGGYIGLSITNGNAVLDDFDGGNVSP